MVTVFCILLLITRPSIVRCFLSVSVMTSASILVGQQRLDLRDLAPNTLHLMRLGELAGAPLHAQVELLLAQVQQLGIQLFSRFLSKFLEFHQRTVRLTKAVWTESLAAARRNASRAVSSGTPSIS